MSEHALYKGLVPLSAHVEAEEVGFATSEPCINVSGPRVIIELPEQRPVAVLAARHAGDTSMIEPVLQRLRSRRSVAVDDLVSCRELADRLRVRPATIRMWRKRHPEFPRPLLEVGHIRIWDWREVLLWDRERRKRRPAG